MRLLIAATLLATPAFAQRDAEVPPPDPELERETFVLPEGWSVNLFAADPQLANPIQMNFDPAGRLWVATSETYPQIVPGEERRDKILVLQDTDHDGVSDKTTVFADGLLIPTGVVPGDGGAYVANSTKLVHFKDADGDLKADDQSIVLSGFGTEDTHHIIHTFRWGPDQRLYFGQSIYIHSHLETPWGVERLNAGGFWRFDPQTHRAGVLFKGLVNPWGLAFDDHGQAFATDGAGGEGINWILPGGYYKTAFQPPRLLDGLNPGSPKHCGLEIVDGPTLPEDWRGSLITHDFRGHRVCRFVVSDDGAGFASREQVELIKSDHPAFRPVDVKQGPDGAIYIADWYNPIIQHGEVDFRDERRDKAHGRIWRLTFDGRTTPPRDFSAMSNADLLSTLEVGTRYDRRMARRLLNERGQADPMAVRSDVRRWVASLDNTRPNYWRSRLEGIWAQQGLNEIDAGDLDFVLRSPDDGVRSGAVRVLSDVARGAVALSGGQYLNGEAVTEAVFVQRALRRAVDDPNPRVRLEAVRVLADLETADAVELAVRVRQQPMDPWLDYALWLTCRETADTWLPAMADGGLGMNPGDKVFALSAIGGPRAAGLLLAELQSGDIPPEDQADAFRVLASSGTESQLTDAVRLAAMSESPGPILAAISEAAARRKSSVTGVSDGLRPLLEGDAAADVARVIGRLRVVGLRDELVDIAGSERPAEVRVAAVDGLASLADRKSVAELTRLSEAELPPPVAEAVLRSLLTLNPKAAVERLLSDADVDEASRRRLFAEVVALKAATDVAVTRLEATPADAVTAKLLLSAVNASPRPDPRLKDLLGKSVGRPSGPRKLSESEWADLRQRLATADPHRGEAVFRREALACVKCHAVGGAGGNIGPELRSLGATAPLEYIVESLLDPNAKVKEGYGTTLIVTDEGRVLSGIKVRETEEEIVLRDAEGRELSVSADTIDLEEPGPSLMPAGLVDVLTDAELADLVAYMKALGTQPEFTVTPANTARLWQVMQPGPDAAYALRRKSYAAAATEDAAFAWKTVYATAAGRLPLADLPQVTVKNRSAAGSRGVAFARTWLTVPDGERANLSVEDGAGLTGWVDDEPVDFGDNPPEVSAGTHQITIAVETSERKRGLRMTSDRGEFRLDPPDPGGQ